MFLYSQDVQNIIIDTENLQFFITEGSELLNFVNKQSKNKRVFVLYKDKSHHFNFLLSTKHNSESNFHMYEFIYYDKLGTFQKVIQENKLMPIDTVIITSDSLIVSNFNRFGFDSIQLYKIINDNYLRSLPSYLVISLSEANRVLNGGYTYGYSHELFVNSIQLSEFKKRRYMTTKRSGVYPNLQANLFLAGRYFTKRDKRHYSHNLSQMILEFKDGNKKLHNEFAKMLSKGLDHIIKKTRKIDFITIVPPREDRLSPLTELIMNKKFDKYRDLIIPDILVARMYPKQTDMIAKHDRERNVQGVFSCRNYLTGHVVLIDDIFTTGSTSLECAKILMENGANQVSILPIAITQV